MVDSRFADIDPELEVGHVGGTHDGQNRHGRYCGHGVGAHDHDGIGRGWRDDDHDDNNENIVLTNQRNRTNCNHF